MAGKALFAVKKVDGKVERGREVGGFGFMNFSFTCLPAYLPCLLISNS